MIFENNTFILSPQSKKDSTLAGEIKNKGGKISGRLNAKCNFFVVSEEEFNSALKKRMESIAKRYPECKCVGRTFISESISRGELQDPNKHVAKEAESDFSDPEEEKNGEEAEEETEEKQVTSDYHAVAFTVKNVREAYKYELEYGGEINPEQKLFKSEKECEDFVIDKVARDWWYIFSELSEKKRLSSFEEFKTVVNSGENHHVDHPLSTHVNRYDHVKWSKELQVNKYDLFPDKLSFFERVWDRVWHLKYGLTGLRVDLKKLRESGNLSDCELFGFKCHRLIVQARTNMTVDALVQKIEGLQDEQEKGGEEHKENIAMLINWIYSGQFDDSPILDQFESRIQWRRTSFKKKTDLEKKKKMFVGFLGSLGLEYEKSISDDLVKLSKEGNEDFEIVCNKDQEKEKIRFKVHSLIIAARSKTFMDMFLNVESRSSEVVDYSNRSAAFWKMFIPFLYSGKLSWRELDLDLLHDELEDMEKYFQLCPENKITSYFDFKNNPKSGMREEQKPWELIETKKYQLPIYFATTSVTTVEWGNPKNQSSSNNSNFLRTQRKAKKWIRMQFMKVWGSYCGYVKRNYGQLDMPMLTHCCNEHETHMIIDDPFKSSLYKITRKSGSIVITKIPFEVL
ncbi:hypothetical protein M0813_22968 [Anaeramoeba flamelloides]|uniref:BTB domain-containing protein n=1 Tax=Anaeramoeba flamelloides TaxID=1746091 RepID=A0ABQ8YC74_9EUKA|nr:hypothetical protein M0813_22968 [Anaeramoeba flamelloides]